MQYVASITSVLSDHLGWHRARLTFIARFTTALLTQTPTNLKRLALTLKGGVKPTFNYHRIQRFLEGYDMDRTEWHFGPAGIACVAGVT